MVGKSGRTKMASGEGSARSFFKLALEIFVLARERVAAYGREARKNQGLRAIDGGRPASKICGRNLQILRLIAAGSAVKWWCGLCDSDGALGPEREGRGGSGEGGCLSEGRE